MSLDIEKGEYGCSVRTMYRILAENQQVRERLAKRRNPVCAEPELLATGPNQVWSWDLTKLRGPVKWTDYYLYVVLELYSRYVVTWMLAHPENGQNARALFAQVCRQHHIEPGLPADRGTNGEDPRRGVRRPRGGTLVLATTRVR